MGKILFWSPNDINGEFSNLYLSPMVIDNIEYMSNEHYFQSKKFEGTEWGKYIASLPTPSDAAIEGRRTDLPLRTDWEQVKEGIMVKGLVAKFTQNENLKDFLIKTDPCEIVENSPYDYYWGVGFKGTGLNRLGILLMQVREKLI